MKQLIGECITLRGCLHRSSSNEYCKSDKLHDDVLVTLISENIVVLNFRMLMRIKGKRKGHVNVFILMYASPFL
jgi:hypothetical protein